MKRTTRLDVGLVLSAAGVAYLVWALVAGISREVVQAMINSTADWRDSLPHATRVVKVFFVDAGFVIDLVGLAWLTVTLLLVVLSSRQRISVSWAWVSAICQSFVAALGAVLVGWAAYQPHIRPLSNMGKGQTHWEQVSSISLPVVMPICLLIWVTFLVWLLVERARLNRRGPSLRDGLRSNTFR
jgi:hypothetical protein